MFLRARSPRTVGILAITGAVIGLVLTPPMAAVWSYEPGVDWSSMRFVVRTFGPPLESSGLLTFGSSSNDDLFAYEISGKGFFLVYLFMLPIIRALRPYEAEGFGRRVSRWGWRFIYIGTAIALVGDFAAYWGKSIPGFVGDQIWSRGFLVEILGVLAALAGTVVFAIASASQRLVPLAVPLLLIVGVASIVPVNGFLTAYAPNSVVPLSLAWAAIGAWWWASQAGAPEPSV